MQHVAVADLLFFSSFFFSPSPSFRDFVLVSSNRVFTDRCIHGRRRRRRLKRFLCFFNLYIHYALACKRICDYPVFFLEFLSKYFPPGINISRLSKRERKREREGKGDVNVSLVKWKYFKFLSTPLLCVYISIPFLRAFNNVRCLNFRTCIPRINVFL